MIRTKTTTTSWPFAALCGLVLCSVSTQAQTYQITEIAAEADQETSVPAAINIDGQISGTSGDYAFRSFDGKKESLGSLPGGKVSHGFGINDLADVVGDSTFGEGDVSHATVFVKGEAFDLGTLPKFGNYSVARSINLARQVVGFVGPEGVSAATRGFIWDQESGMQALPTLGGDYSQAFAISDTRYVTGNAQLTSGSLQRHAFLYHPKAKMRNLGTLGGTSSYGTFVNASGHVVGYADLSSGKFQNTVHAFFFDGKTMRDLGSLGSQREQSTHSAAFGINANDEIVGTTYANLNARELVQVAFLYKDGTMYDLNTLVDEASQSYQLQSATAINDAGQIVVQALDRKSNTVRALLLSPNNIR